MKYTNTSSVIPQNKRKSINDKIIYLIDSGTLSTNEITQEDI